MNEGFDIPKKREHLKEGVKPIMTCIGSWGDLVFDKKLNLAKNTNYLEAVQKLQEENSLNSGYKTYILPIPDNCDKFSDKFFDCTGVVVVGVDKETGENISFLSHQDPVRFLNDKKDDFVSHFNQRLIEIKDRCVPGTIDAVIVGGNYTSDDIDSLDLDGVHIIDADYTGTILKRNYIDSIRLLSEETKQILGFEPSVINGPKIGDGYDTVFFDNKNRRLYLMRPKVNQETGNFTQGEIEKEKENWEEKEDF